MDRTCPIKHFLKKVLNNNSINNYNNIYPTIIIKKKE